MWAGGRRGMAVRVEKVWFGAREAGIVLGTGGKLVPTVAGGGQQPASTAAAPPSSQCRCKHACAVLRCHCRRALRQIISRAQQTDDERLLSNPYLQVKAMLDSGLVGPQL